MSPPVHFSVEPVKTTSVHSVIECSRSTKPANHSSFERDDFPPTAHTCRSHTSTLIPENAGFQRQQTQAKSGYRLQQISYASSSGHFYCSV